MIKTYLTPQKSVFLFSLMLCLSSCFKDTDDQDSLVLSILSPSDKDNPEPFRDVMKPIETLPYNEIPDSKYIIELDRWDIPNNRTEPIKTTDHIQEAIDWAVSEGYGTICLPAGHYLIGKYGNNIYQSGIELSSNMAFMLDKDAIIEMDPNDKWNYCAISVTREAHVVISGGAIIGDRDNHIYTPRESDGSILHDGGHLICIEDESEYVTVENVTLGKANGDGISLVAAGEDESSVKYISIIRNNIVDSRKQGISIDGGTDVLIDNNEIHHTSGALPEEGIHIETEIYTNANITVQNNYFHNNIGEDVTVVGGLNVFVDTNNIYADED